MRQLQTLQVARGLAAIAVVLYHANLIVAGRLGAGAALPLDFASHGVDFFFILSGFVICFAHAGDVGRPERLRDYAVKRAVRLYPIAWVVVLCYVVLRAAAGHWPESAWAVIDSLTFLPGSVEPIPGVIWTLRHEVLFYCLFAAVIASRRLGLAVLALWLLGCAGASVAALTGHPAPGLLPFFLSAYHFDFLLGAGLAALHARKSFQPSLAPLAVALAVLGVLALAESRFNLGRSSLADYTSFSATAWTLAIGCGFALLVHGLLALESVWRPNRGLILAGEASYSLYLVHLPVIGALAGPICRVATGLGLPGAGLALAAVAAIAAGVALHLGVEKPMTSALRRRFLRAGARQAAPASALPQPGGA